MIPRGIRNHVKCRKGHPFIAANILINNKGERRCRECNEQYIKKKRRQIHKPLPSETGFCKKGLHHWDYTKERCWECQKKSKEAARQRWVRISCIAGKCRNATFRMKDGTYICPKHRANPPLWIRKMGLKIVGTQVVQDQAA